MKTRQNDDWDWFQYSWVDHPDALLEAAKSAYEQRSRQESGRHHRHRRDERGHFEGRESSNCMALSAGDNVRNSSSTQKDRIALVNEKLPNQFLSVVYLMDWGYSKDVATLMVRNMSDFALLDPVFYVKSVRTYDRPRGRWHVRD